MLRSFLIYLSQAGWAKRTVTGWSFALNMASRFIAGESVDSAIKVVQGLNDKGINATLDQLGEHTANADEAAQATDEILKILDAIEEAIDSTMGMCSLTKSSGILSCFFCLISSCCLSLFISKLGSDLPTIYSSFIYFCFQGSRFSY